MIRVRLFMFFLLFVSITSVNAQTKASTAKVYLDCNNCDTNFIKQEVTIVNYVRDRKVADVQLLITSIDMASGGKKYTVHFIGLQEAYSLNYSININTYQTDAQIEVNRKLTNVILAGLMPYLVNKGSLELKPIFSPTDLTAANNINDEDPWNFWIFEIGGNANFSKESKQENYKLRGHINIERTTKLWRVRGNMRTEYEVNKVTRNDSMLVSSLKRSQGEFSVVKSIAKQWSAGIFTNVRSDTYENIGMGAGIQGALEYNFYPYRLSATKEFTLAYLVGPQYRNYWEETIYGKTEEHLVQQALRINFKIRQPWGNIWARLEGSQFLHDLSKNRLSFNSDLSLQIVKGLFFNVGGEASLVHDQLYLPKGTASLEEVLLNRRALATNFELDFYFGIAYTFGSIYNSIVNTRL